MECAYLLSFVTILVTDRKIKMNETAKQRLAIIEKIGSIANSMQDKYQSEARELAFELAKFVGSIEKEFDTLHKEIKQLKKK